MLSKLRVQHYKSLYDTEVDLEPLTVFIGPNGSGKSNICESLAVLSDFLQRLIDIGNTATNIKDFFAGSLHSASKNPQNIESKFWHGKLDFLSFEIRTTPRMKNHPSPKDDTISAYNYPSPKDVDLVDLSVYLDYRQQAGTLRTSDGRLSVNEQSPTSTFRTSLVSCKYPDSPLASSLKRGVGIYDFSPTALSSNSVPSANIMDRTGQGIAYSLVDILLSNRKGFDELEERLTRLVPNIRKIALPRAPNQTFSLELIDKYSEHHIPASDISDGTLRILAFLTALYQENTPSIICFEEIENGVHPWLLHKMMELLKIVSTEGITGNPVQVLITTHSPILLNYVEPHQVRAVELDREGKTQVHALPIDSARFQKALDAYDGALGELWFTNVFGGNPV
jgi:predicted ATPase